MTSLAALTTARAQTALVALALTAGAVVAASLGLRVPEPLQTGWGLVILLFVSPLLEEWLLRAGLHEALLRRWPGQGAGWFAPITLGLAALFGALHALVQWHWIGLLAMLPGWLIGQIYSLSRSVLIAVALHALANLALLASSRFMGA